MDLKKAFIKHCSDPLLLWKWGHYAVFRYARELEGSQFLSTEELQALQFHRLRRLLVHAYGRCPFYRERFRRISLSPDDIQSLADLRSLPVLEKRDIQERFEMMVPEGWPREELFLDHTGGSTGAPIAFYSNRERRCWGKAATRRHNAWAGWEIGDRVAHVWGAPRDMPSHLWRSRLVNALSGQQIFLDTGHLDERKMASFRDTLVRFRPKIIQAYARSLALFARFLRARGWKPPRPQSIVTSAEVLESSDRQFIEEVFGCPVFNRYGCREVGVIASECPAHQGLHIAAEGLLVEIVQGNDPVAPGESGAILVTDLLNLGMPLIRYRIGDMGTWEEGACPCGRGLPRLREVSGRVTDFLVGADGRLVSGVYLATYVVARRPSLGQVQILQEEAGRVRYRIKPGPGFQRQDDLDYLQNETRRYLGEETFVDWEFTDNLGPEPSGKYIFSRSSVAASSPHNVKG
jgi:phenylacetate-CoA ligase